MIPSAVAARVGHMLTLPVLIDLIVPAYAQAHNCLEEEVLDDVKRGLVDGRLPDALRSAVWDALKKERPGVDDSELVEHLAKAMQKVGRRATPAPDRVLDKMAAFFASIDVQVGRAADTTRAALESSQGKVAVEKAINASGEFLVQRLFPTRTK